MIAYLRGSVATTGLRVEGVKWLALVLMTLDHINAYLFDYTIPGAYELGRLAFPLFALVLSFNLARRPVGQGFGYEKIIVRLLLVGSLTIVPLLFLSGRGSWGMPLNIMFTFAVAVTALWAMQKASFIAVVGVVLLFAASGFVIEYFWFGPILILAAYFFFKTPSLVSLIFTGFAIALLYFVNGNHWSMLALPVFAILSQIPLSMPRMKWFFYAFYPGQFAVLAMLQRVISP